MRHLAFDVALFFWVLSPQAAQSEDSTPAMWDAVSTVFQERCINCHSQFGAAKALRLDSYEGAVNGSENGAVLLPGDSSASELVRRLRGESKPRMPFLSTPLPADDINLIVRWIDAGMPRTSPRE